MSNLPSIPDEPYVASGAKLLIRFNSNFDSLWLDISLSRNPAFHSKRREERFERNGLFTGKSKLISEIVNGHGE